MRMNTLDMDVASLEKMDALAFALNNTRRSKGQEVGNVSNIARLLIDFARDREDAFDGWFALVGIDQKGERKSFSFQAPDEVSDWLSEKAKDLKILRRRDGKKQPNVSKLVRLIAKFAFDNKPTLKLWLLDRIEDALPE